MKTLHVPIIAALLSVGLEPFVWIGALVYFALIDPSASTSLSICPLHNLGFQYCPGCGLGRSISFLLHGDILSSIQTHLLGIPAALVLGGRTISILANAWRRRHYLQQRIDEGSGHGQHSSVDAHS